MRSIFVLGLFLVLFSSSVFSQMMISEIMYDPSGTETKKEWIELYNMGDDQVNMSGWKIQDGATVRSINLFIGNEIINGHSFAILSRNGENFSGEYPFYVQTIFSSTFSLANSGKELFLIDKNSQVIDFVNYTDIADEDFTIEISDKNLDNSDMENWIQGLFKGDPGNILEVVAPEIPPVNDTLNETINDTITNETTEQNVTIPSDENNQTIPIINETEDINETIPEIINNQTDEVNETIPDIDINETVELNETVDFNQTIELNETIPNNDINETADTDETYENNQTIPEVPTEDEEPGEDNETTEEEENHSEVPEFDSFGVIIVVVIVGFWVMMMRKN